MNRKRAKTSNNDNNEIARSTGLTFKKQIKKQSNTGVTIDDDVVMMKWEHDGVFYFLEGINYWYEIL